MSVVSQAEFFLNAYNVLDLNEKGLSLTRKKRAMEHNIKNPDRPAVEIGYIDDLQTGVVDFVCLAFAVELYLKAVFQVIGQGTKRGHNIKKLFESLPVEAQKNIFHFHMKNIYGATMENYKEQMLVISDGFEQFRYAHEHSELYYHKGFALKMIESIKQFIAHERSQKV